MYNYQSRASVDTSSSDPRPNYLVIRNCFSIEKRSQERLIQSLLDLPDYWKLIPCKNKVPLGKRWNKNFFTPKVLFRSLTQSGKVWVLGRQGYYQARPNGYSLLCGNQLRRDRFLVAIDCDSQTALDKVKSCRLPATVSWCSGKVGRRQYLYYLDRPIQSFQTTEGLEIKAGTLPITLPPSAHPDTGQYHWIIPPDRIKIPTISSLWLNSLRECKPVKKIEVQQECRDTAEAAKLLDAIDPAYADDYTSWVKIGMALKDWDASLLWLWDDWSRRSAKYKPGEPEIKWHSFNGSGITFRTLYHYAKAN